MIRKLILTSDGTHTVFVPGMNEHYHSVHGALQESRHIFIEAGLSYCKSENISVFEAGFGTGLNALLTALYAEEEKRKIVYTSIEKYPLPEDITGQLNYGCFAGNHAAELFSLIHSSEWNKDARISSHFTLKKLSADLLTYDLTGNYDLIYFDAFGPDKQPEMWSTGVFRKISEATVKGGIFVTYSSKGDVRRKLGECGFTVSLLPGPPHKRHIIRAIKN